MTGVATNPPINHGKLNQIMLIELQQLGGIRSVFSTVQSRYTFLLKFHSVWEGVNRGTSYHSSPIAHQAKSPYKLF